MEQNFLLTDAQIICPHGGWLDFSGVRDRGVIVDGKCPVTESDFKKLPVCGCSNPPNAGGSCLGVSLIGDASFMEGILINSERVLKREMFYAQSDKQFPLNLM